MWIWTVLAVLAWVALVLWGLSILNVAAKRPPTPFDEK